MVEVWCVRIKHDMKQSIPGVNRVDGHGGSVECQDNTQNETVDRVRIGRARCICPRM